MAVNETLVTIRHTGHENKKIGVQKWHSIDNTLKRIFP